MTSASPSNYPPGVSGTEPQITGESEEGIDPLQVALAELAGDVVPTPEDLLDNCGPLTCLYYATQVLAFTAGRWAGTLDLGGADAPDDGSEPVQALQAITEALGVCTGACVLVSIYPPEAASKPAGALANEGT